MSSKLAFGGITKFFFKTWHLATGLQKHIGRSDLAKLLQSGASPVLRCDLHFDNHWCLETTFFFKISALWRYQVIWRLGDGFHKPLEGVTLPSRVSHELWKRYLHLNNHLFTKQYRTIITWNRFFLEGISLEKLVQGLLSHCLGRKKGHRWGPKNEHLVAGTRSGASVPLSGRKTP